MLFSALSVRLVPTRSLQILDTHSFMSRTRLRSILSLSVDQTQLGTECLPRRVMQVGKTSVSQAIHNSTSGLHYRLLTAHIDDALNELPAFPGIPQGNPGSSGRPDVGSTEWDASYAIELLGKGFIGLKETFRETEAYYQEKGWSFTD